MDKDLKKVVKAATKQGFTHDVTSRGHVKFFKNGVEVSTFSGTPSDFRSWKNSISNMRRGGFIWPRDGQR